MAMASVTTQPGTSSSDQGSETVSIVLLGMTGVGKSATGNTILSLDPAFGERKPFVSTSNPTSITQRCEVRQGSVLGQGVSIVDTPGFKDTDKTYKEIVNEIVQAVLLVAPGPHIILLVVRMTRMTTDVIDALKQARQLFGEEFTKFIIVIFTEYDALQHDGTALDTWLQNMKPEYKALLDACEQRYIAFNNRLTTIGDVETQVKPLIKMIVELKEKNSGARYTNQILRRAENIFRETEHDIHRKQAEDCELQRKLEDKLREIARSQGQKQSSLEMEVLQLKAEKELLQTIIGKIPAKDDNQYIVELAKLASNSKESQKFIKEVTNTVGPAGIQVPIDIMVTGCKCC